MVEHGRDFPRRPLWLAGLLVLLSCPASAFDLVEAWQAARQYDAAFAASRAELDAGLEQKAIGRAALLPSISFKGQYGSSNEIEPAISGGSYESHGWRTELEQPLFDVKAWTDYRKGDVGSDSARIAFDEASQQLILKVTRSYLEVLQAQDVLAAVRASKQAFAQQVQQAREAFNVGADSVLGIYEAEASYDTAVAEEIAALSMLDVKRHLLGQLTGLNGAALAPLRDNLQLEPPEPASIDYWVARAMQANPRVRLGSQQKNLAELSLTAARGAQLPTVSLSAAYLDSTGNKPGWKRPDTRTSSLGINLSLPLFAGGGLNASRRQAAALLEKATQTEEATRRQVANEVYNAYLGVSNGIALVKANEQRLRSAASKREATRIGREVGNSSLLDLLDAERAYYDTQRTLSESRYNYLLARMQLALAAGELGEDSLRSINRFF